MANKPIIYMIAGCNGAGKSTLANILLPDFLHLNVLVNADEIARGLNPLDPASMRMKAGRIALEQIDDYIAAGKSFAFETTAAGTTHKKRLQTAQKKGYQINLVYLYVTDPRLAVLRVKLRTRQGGHSVPVADIRRRYVRGIYHVLNDYLPIADEAAFYLSDNQYVREPFASKKKGRLMIYDSDMWQNLKNKENKYHEKFAN
jgi:predicted ABC-type ATPase